MRIRSAIAILAGTAMCLAVTAGAGAATPAQYGATCNKAWTGKRGTPAYRTYKKACVGAAVSDFFSSFVSAAFAPSFLFSSVFGASLGAPFGNAVLNLPVTNAAIVFLPLGVICFETSSGWANWSIALARSPDWADVSITGVNVSELPALGERLPASMNIAELS